MKNKAMNIQEVEDLRQEILDMITSTKWTHHQKVFNLANLADRFMKVMDLPEGLDELMKAGAICDLFEGQAPIRPRYICPDYPKLMKEGCQFLRLDPPQTLQEALQTLLIFYHNVPSVTNFPVFIGELDKLLEPFVLKVSREEAKNALHLFLMHIDRTITDSFCHANIGPEATVTGELILELEEELVDAVPNLTIKYDPEISPKDFALKAIKTQLAVAKPSFANHKMFCRDLGEDYGIASCYNGLYLGGGSFTLVRMLFGHLAKLAKNSEDFFSNVLPHAVKIMLQYMDERIKFIVEESNFFKYNFLVKEGFIKLERFTAMFGIVGIAECVNDLMIKDGFINERYGHSEKAHAMGIKIMDYLKDANEKHNNKYCSITNHHFLLHGQVGIAEDINETPTTRIPIGEEPENLADHIRFQASFDHYMPSGTGEIFKVEHTIHTNPQFALDLIDGAFKVGCRYLSVHDSNSDVIRVTGYLAKRSDIEKLNRGEAVLQDTTHLGAGAAKNGHILERKNR